MVDKPDPDKVTAANAVEKYEPWLKAGVQRLREHTRQFADLGDAKPVLFVMAERANFADKIGEWMTSKNGGKLKPEEVLIIHTKANGELREKDLDVLRKAAREVDDPDNPIRAIVSVLMLREGWDVRNVTVALGLRPFSSKANILPEQAVGRGLRLMRAFPPEFTQVLEVLGTQAFEDFVRGLEAEGVGITTRTKPPKQPVIIQPVKERSQYDIAIPQTGPTLERHYTKIEDFDPADVPSMFTLEQIAESRALMLRVEHGTVRTEHGEIAVEQGRVPLGAELISSITDKAQKIAGLTFEFAQLAPRVRAYLEHHCFDGVVDVDEGSALPLVEAPAVRQFLADYGTHEKIASVLARHLGELTVEAKPITIEPEPILMSETKPYPWRRDHLECKRTVFNLVATYNDFESAFAEFLDAAPDVERFAALAEHFTRFHVNYLKPSGAIGMYFPDYVAVQSTSDGPVNWIIETKGRVWEGTEAKDDAIERWCDDISDLSGESWRYVRVDQAVFELVDDSTLEALVDRIGARQVESQVRLVV